MGGGILAAAPRDRGGLSAARLSAPGGLPAPLTVPIMPGRMLPPERLTWARAGTSAEPKTFLHDRDDHPEDRGRGLRGRSGALHRLRRVLPGLPRDLLHGEGREGA